MQFSFPMLGAFSAADLRLIGIQVICLILSIAVHEFAHAYVAHRLGDPTPERDGRVTLNPAAHADPIGTLLLPAFLAFANIGMFGWGKPVMTQPFLYTRKISMRAGQALVAAAGPASNIALATVALGLLAVLNLSGVTTADTKWLLPVSVFFQLNLLLAAFNMLPLHPLDGGKVLTWLLPERFQHVDDFLLKYGGIILIVLVFVLSGVLHTLLAPVFWVGGVAWQWVMTATLSGGG